MFDECTSGVSIDVEPKVYQYAKELGITLITCAHRPGLKKYHDFILKLDGMGNAAFSPMDPQELELDSNLR